MVAMQESNDIFRAELKGKIAFVSHLQGVGYEICEMPANDLTRKRLATFAIADTICFIGWSPNGKQIAFTSYRSGNYEIYAMNANGSRQKRLTYMGCTTYGAGWSPDGKQIAFTSVRSGTEEVYVMNNDGSNVKRMTATSYIDASGPKAYNKNPAWSPDGQQIVFASARHGNQEIFIMNADGSNPRQITDSRGMKDFPSWSPDGKYIAFTHGGISVIETSGANLRPITTSNLMDICPTWSPDGQYVACSSRVNVDLKTRPPQIGHYEIFVTHVASTQSLRLTMTDIENSCPSWIA
jgi:TolB protein